MACFYLHLHNDIGFVPDEEGKELPDLESAPALALESIRGMIGAEAQSGVISLRGRIEIRDEAGKLLTVVPFSDAVQVKLGDERG